MPNLFIVLINYLTPRSLDNAVVAYVTASNKLPNARPAISTDTPYFYDNSIYFLRNDFLYMRKNKDRNENAVFNLFIKSKNLSMKVSKRTILGLFKRPIRTYCIYRKLTSTAAFIRKRYF